MFEAVEFLKGCGELVQLRENGLGFGNQQPIYNIHVKQRNHQASLINARCTIRFRQECTMRRKGEGKGSPFLLIMCS